MNLDLLICCQNDGAIGDGVGRNRGEDEGLQVGTDDRAARGKGVSCGAVGGGDDDPICLKGVEVIAIDMDRDLY